METMIKNVHGNTVDHLGEAIVAGRYGVGATIPSEPVLCQQLGVSRTVVREAVKSLIAKGLMTTGPKVGARVLSDDHWNWFDPDVIFWQSKAGLTPEFIRDLQDLRRVLEPAAMRLAAQRATEQDIAEIEAAFAGMKHAVEAGGDYVTHDLKFHQGLLRASFEISTRRKGGPAKSLSLHRAVLDAVIAHDPDAAETAIRVLIDGASVDIDKVLASRRALPSLNNPASNLKAA